MNCNIAYSYYVLIVLMLTIICINSDANLLMIIKKSSLLWKSEKTALKSEGITITRARKRYNHTRLVVQVLYHHHEQHK